MGKSLGRKRGGRNKGYWFRAGRGWYVGKEPLKDAQGKHIRDREQEEEAKKAYCRMVAAEDETPAPAEPKGEAYTVRDICLLYLKEAKKGSRATYDLRYRLLRDFCDGKSPYSGKRIHKGYGDLPIDKLIGLHVKEWLEAHNWDGSRRMAVQAVRRAILYCKTLGVVKVNPIAGFNAGVAGKRNAYFTEEQEKAIYATAPKALGEAIRAMIVTGVRPSELAKLEKRHVEETPNGQLWRYRPEEHKTGWKTKKDRVVPVAPEIAALVREKIKHSRGKLFRNSRGKPWTPTGMKTAFARLRTKLAKMGIKLAPDCTMYGARHTYAKRMLAKGVTMENLAAKMGNTPQICWDHYGKDWDRQKDNAPALWEGLS